MHPIETDLRQLRVSSTIARAKEANVTAVVTCSKAKKTLLTKPRKKLLTRMWMQCYRDWACRDRDLLGYDCNNDRVGLTQGDIGRHQLAS